MIFLAACRTSFVPEVNKMSSFLDRLLNREPKSAQLAKERLKLILVHDRTDLTSQTLDELKDQLIQVVSQHVEIDSKAVRVEMQQDGRIQRLIADIPLRTGSRRKHIR